MSSTKKTAKTVKAKAMARSSSKEKVKTGLSGKTSKSEAEKVKLKAAATEKAVSKAKDVAKAAAKHVTKPAVKSATVKPAAKPVTGKAPAEVKVDKKSAGTTTVKAAPVQVLKPVTGKKPAAPPKQEIKTTIVKKPQQAKDAAPPAKDKVPAKSAAPVKPAAKASTKATEVKVEAKVETKPAVKAAAKPAPVKAEAAKPAAAPKAKAELASPAAEVKPSVQPAAPRPVAGAPVPPRTGLPPGRFGASRQPFPPIVKPAAAVAGGKPGKTGFKTHEYIVYPAHGVGQIIATEEQEVAGHKLELYVISFLKDKLTLKVPLPKVLSGAIRKLSDAATVQKSLDTLTGRARIKRTMWSRRAQEYEAKINSGDLVAIAEVVRDLYRSEAQPEQSYSERQLYEAALDRMAREVGVVQKLTETESLKVIEQHLEKGPRRGSRSEAASDADGDADVDADNDGEIEAAA
ncbi:CarD family transcriptional regulator [Methylocella sp. CPCC 101449]|jgi:CarD family transcriptional regulator|uniref:CarD family transcriptional regulator n=1 Tax=Methylocella sp. CPCC 101449 TaxID=2987531 RepID=UPI002893132C|nr:CarD family transcriptional regulator [Methylocella sp. CPCC 101449]HEV2574423.1 CarD family transcriptional regulator [Beijerinckiaceae bacterium]